MRAFGSTLVAVLALMFLAVTPVQADPNNYGIEVGQATLSTAQAGDHPDFTTVLALKREANDELPATTSEAIFELPPGLSGNPQAVPACSLAKFVSTDVEDKSNANGCPQASQVGITEVELFNVGGVQRLSEPVYNLEPREGEPARLGFFGASFPVVLDTRLRSESDYGVTAVAEGISSLIPLLSAATTIWAVPADESHDAQRITPYEALHSGGTPDTPNGKRSSGLVPKPFMLNPVQCGVSQGVNVAAIPYSLPAQRFEVFAPLEPNFGCGSLDFSPALSLAPTSSRAETGAGLDLQLDFPDDGLEAPNLLGEDIQKRVELLLPEGITVNPSQGAGLGACSKAQYAVERFDSPPGAGCPEDSKIGTVSARSPLLAETAEGSLFIARPYENPFDTLIALYMVVKIPERGVIVKLPIRVEADSQTGRLRSVVDGIPQLPVSSFSLHFRSGPRSPLVTPRGCGIYTATASFSSWGGHSATLHPSFTIDTGPDGGPCPSATPPFHPGFTAGALNNNAASFSPYYLRLQRSDSDQELTRFAVKLPPGSLAKLAGVSACPAAAIEAARARQGAEELASPSCPSGSEVGHLLAGAGAGSTLTYVPGKLYLAGPYNGAPLSVAAIVPAVAGPFDLGTVVTRVALRIDPETGVAEADGSRSEPIPHILAGIPLRTRDVRVYIDRPEFTTVPTNCDPLSFRALLWGAGADPFTVADDTPTALSERFQAANCAALPFKPKLSLTLKGKTKRTSHPKLIANLTARPGEANIARAQVKLPRAAFIDQAHIGTVCTRVQFAADSCPAGSIYGKASATTPLLDYQLSGPVYLRSSSHALPDLVVTLKGPDSQPIEIALAGTTDAVKGALRNTFEAVPDAPVSKFHLELFGGKRGLIILSSGLCKSPKATVKLDGQNGKAFDTRPTVRTSCPKKSSKHGKHGSKK